MVFKKGHPFYGDLSKPNYFQKGNKGYWLGKKKDNSYLKEHQFKKGEHRSIKTEFKKGQISPNKGKILLYMYGEKNPAKKKEVREKISLMQKKFYQTTRGIELKKLNSFILKQERDKQVFPLKDSKIELKIQDFLRQLRIEFFTHQYIHIEHGYQCDILIPLMNLVIECDGDYWHGNREIYSEARLSERIRNQRKIDEIRKKEMEEKGFKVLRLWENEIHSMNLEDFKSKINIPA